MQKKTLTLIPLLVFVFGLIVLSGNGMASDKEPATAAGPADMELKTAAAKKPAKFPHGNHQKDFECAECHHYKTNDGEKFPYVEGMEIKKCVTCHNKDNMSNPKLNTFKLAAHGLCKECHKKNRDSAPTKCSGCHVKK
jgi:hypothetical protein